MSALSALPLEWVFIGGFVAFVAFSAWLLHGDANWASRAKEQERRRFAQGDMQGRAADEATPRGRSDGADRGHMRR